MALIERARLEDRVDISVVTLSHHNVGADFLGFEHRLMCGTDRAKGFDQLALRDAVALNTPKHDVIN